MSKIDLNKELTDAEKKYLIKLVKQGKFRNSWRGCAVQAVFALLLILMLIVGLLLAFISNTANI